MKKVTIFLGTMLFGLVLTALAQENLRVEDLDLSLDSTDPVITIKREDNHIAEEYRVNNRLYMVKITPNMGPSYYLVDADGSGEMGLRRNSVGLDVRPPQWVLFSW